MTAMAEAFAVVFVEGQIRMRATAFLVVYLLCWHQPLLGHAAHAQRVSCDEPRAETSPFGGLIERQLGIPVSPLSCLSPAVLAAICAPGDQPSAARLVAGVRRTGWHGSPFRCENPVKSRCSSVAVSDDRPVCLFMSLYPPSPRDEVMSKSPNGPRDGSRLMPPKPIFRVSGSALERDGRFVKRFGVLDRRTHLR